MSDDENPAIFSLLQGSATTLERFFIDYWERAALHVARDSPTAFNGVLTIEDLDELLCRAQLPGADAELIVFKDLRQQPVPGKYATPHIAYASGASLVINHTDWIWPPVNEFCQQLGERFSHAYANLYITPKDSQTAPPHTDGAAIGCSAALPHRVAAPAHTVSPLLPADRDVFVLQLHGEKAWNVWSADGARTQVMHVSSTNTPGAGAMTISRTLIRRSPLRRVCAQPLPYMDEQAGKDDELLYERELGEPELRCTLRRGDVLYIPRGAPHVARTHGAPSPSLHLTIAIPTADLSWGSFVMQAVAAASGVSKWRALRSRDVELDFRRALPLGPLPPPSPLPLPPLKAGNEVAEGAVAAAEPPPPAPAAAEAWVTTHTELYTTLHKVTYAEARCVMRHKLLSKARNRAKALALVQRQMASRGAPSSLRPTDMLRKLVAVELLDQGRVVQTRPEEGIGQRLLHTFLPTELLPAVTAFAAMHCGQAFALSELGGDDDALLLACAARRLMALDAVLKE